MPDIVKIRSLPSASDLSDGDYAAIDNSTDGLRKVALGGIISDLKGSLNEFGKGNITFAENMFIRGTINNANGEYVSGYNYRVAIKDIQTATEDIVFKTIENGFTVIFYSYNNDDSYSGHSEFSQAGEYTISKGSKYKMQILRSTEDTSEVADIGEFVRAVTFYSAQMVGIMQIEKENEGIISDIDGLKSGFETFDASMFYRGTINNGNGEYVGRNYDYRVAIKDIQIADKNIVIGEVLSGFNVVYYTFGSDDTYVGYQNLSTFPHTIPANTHYKMQILRSSEDTSELADIDQFVRSIKLLSDDKIAINNLQAEDVKINAELVNLKAGSYTLDSTEIMQLGGIRGDGTINDTNVLIMSKDYLNGVCNIVKSTNGYKFNLVAYQSGTYVGTWNGTEFSKRYDGILINEAYLDDYPSEYSYKISGYNPDRGFKTLTIADSLNYSFLKYMDAIDKLAQDISALKKDADFVSLNADVKNSVIQSTRSLGGNSTKPLSLIHFSDCHNDGKRIQQIVDYAETIADYYDDIIHTGDAVLVNYSQGISGWLSVEGHEKILNTIGNHDCDLIYSTDTAPGQTQQTLYNTFFAPYVDDTGITISENKTYWYKDYATEKVRLICLNSTLVDSEETEQNTWLSTVLSGAKTNNYTVLMASHYMPKNFVKVDCNFTRKVGAYYIPNMLLPEIYQETVKTFIDGGGKFSCWIGGHTHYDIITYNSNYTNQFFVNVTCSAFAEADDDFKRVNGEKTENAFNFLTIDTDAHVFKIVRIGADRDFYLRHRGTICIDYTTGQIISET